MNKNSSKNHPSLRALQHTLFQFSQIPNVVFVPKEKQKGGSGYEKLEKCLTEPVAKTLQNFALVKESPVQLMMDVIDLDLEKIVAKELYYHRTCYRDYTRPEKKDDSTRLVELDAFFGIWY